jgi:hypothetical protein
MGIFIRVRSVTMRTVADVGRLGAQSGVRRRKIGFLLGGLPIQKPGKRCGTGPRRRLVSMVQLLVHLRPVRFV